MTNLELYFQSKDITYLHDWVSNNYKLFHYIVNRAIKRGNSTTEYDPIEHDDLFQEAIIIFYRCVDRYDASKGSFSTFIVTVLTNELSNLIKLNRRSDFAKRVSAVELDAPIDLYDGEASIDSTVSITDEEYPMRSLLLNELTNYVSNNCTKRVQIIYNLYTQGLTLEEIGDKLGISKQAVNQSLKKLVKDVQMAWGV